MPKDKKIDVLHFIQVDDDIAQMIEAAAAENKITKDEVIRQAIQEFINERSEE